MIQQFSVEECRPGVANEAKQTVRAAECQSVVFTLFRNCIFLFISFHLFFLLFSFFFFWEVVFFSFKFCTKSSFERKLKKYC